MAVACGYYDYQHMARDFRHFTGLTPPALLDTQSADEPEAERKFKGGDIYPLEARSLALLIQRKKK